MSWLTAIILLAIILFIAYVIWILIWPSWKNVTRDQFAHWIHGLIRYYEDSSSFLVTSKSPSESLFRFRREGSDTNGCILVFEILNTSKARQHQEQLKRVFEKKGLESSPCSDNIDDLPIVININIEDIWHVGAGNRAARLAHAALDAMEIDKRTKFKLSPNGARSRERTLEARSRQKSGLDLHS